MQRWTTKAALFFLAVATLNYWPVLLGRIPLPADLLSYSPAFQYRDWSWVQGKHSEMGDSITQFYPWRALAGQSLRHGIIPLWNPRQLSGSPTAADDVSAMFYPPTWTFALLPPTVAWSLTLILKTALAGFFMALFVRSIGATEFGAIFSGLVFAFCGYMTAWQLWPQSDSALWLPLICYAIQMLRREPGGRYVSLMALALAMSILAGHPGVAAYVLLVAGLYAAFEFVFIAGSRKWFAIACGMAGILALGIAAIQILPTMEWLKLIHRTLDLTWGPLPTTQWVALFSRDIAGTPNSFGLSVPLGVSYAGSITLLLLPVAVFHNARKEVAFFAAMALVSGLVAYGIEPLSSFALTMPIIKAVKKDELLVLVDLGLALLAGLGFTVLQEWKPIGAFDWRRVLIWATSGCVFLIAFMGVLSLRALAVNKSTLLHSIRPFGILFVFGLLLVVARLYGFIDARAWSVIAVAVIGLDMLSFSHGYVPFEPASAVFPPNPVFESLHSQAGPFRVIGLDEATGLNWEQMYGLDDAGGYDFQLETLFQLTTDLGDDPNVVIFRSDKVAGASHRIIDLLNVKYLITASESTGSSSLAGHPERFRKESTVSGLDIFENLNVLPRAFAVPDRGIEVMGSEYGQYHRIRANAFDPTASVVLPNALSVARPSPSPAQGGNSRLLEFHEGTNDVQLRITAEQPSVVVLGQMYYPGWSVLVDGNPAPFLRTDYAFAGTHIEAGTHDVHFTFRPWTFRIGAIFCLLSSAVVAFLLLKPAQIRGAMVCGVLVLGLSLTASALVVESTTSRPTSFGDELLVDKTEVTNDQDYVITIPGSSNSVATVRYSLNSSAPEEFTVYLDSQGQSRLKISAATKRGVYRFLAFRFAGNDKWVPCDSGITVR